MKTPPNSPEAEAAIIGMALGTTEAALRASAELTSNMFYDKSNLLTFHVICELSSSGMAVTPITLNEGLKKLGATFTPNYAIDPVFTNAKLTSLIRIVRNNFLVRRRIETCEKIAAKGYDTNNTEEFIKESDKEFWDSEALLSGNTAVLSSGGMLEARRKTMIERASLIPVMTGYPELDEKLTGGCFAPGIISVVAGRPNMGKSAFKSNLITKLCPAGFGVASVAIEQTLATEMDRVDSILLGIPGPELRNSKHWPSNDSRIERVKALQREIDEKWNYHIIHKRGLGLRDVYVLLQQIQMKRPVHVVFFDLFDKLLDVNVSQNKPQTVGKKLGELAVMAQELNVHMCLLVQIHREVEKRKDKRPGMADLKDSGSYEEVARWILGVYRDRYYNPENISDIMEVSIMKQNDGPSNVKVDFEFLPEAGRIEEMASLSRIYRDGQ